jgi:hypothetical protein
MLSQENVSCTDIARKSSLSKEEIKKNRRGG